ncbi:hypothetical protein SAMN04487950_3066 [Halogranum rubrum]|uniref:Small CPxCG-related zinc finger protein n=1 Tax=Halogranum rubrum TaxID=553466 RepID=A0A1I4G8J9_9EURY|nr:DUF6276 family protein [Halogranum rubrum]SFL25451.1 hypothetical protein SAMN04487950_3066 [Halogranum rubrum]
MHCTHCDVETVTFAVPPALRAHAPDESDAASICPQCLRVVSATEGPVDSSFDALGPSFPHGEAGVAMALLVGLLDSIALNRRAIEDVAAHAERHGADVFLTLDRLAATTADPSLDLNRRLVQLHSVLD